MTETIELPTKVVKSNGKDDIDYEPYKDEKTYISPDKVKRETIDRIKGSPIRLTIEGMFALK